MFHDIKQLKRSLEDLESLITEVAEGYFIPKRFRKAPFTQELKAEYLTYLNEEADELHGRIKAIETPASVAPDVPGKLKVIVRAKEVSTQ